MKKGQRHPLKSTVKFREIKILLIGVPFYMQMQEGGGGQNNPLPLIHIPGPID